MPWELKDLRAYIRQLPGGGRDMQAVLSSLARSHSIFGYHVCTARDAMNGILDKEDPTSRNNFKVIFGDAENATEVNRASVVSEAHIIGCMHTVRSIADFFAQLVNGLVLGNKFDVDRCELKHVINAMPDSELQARLKSLFESYWFGYVTGFINTTKHRQLVQHSTSLAFDEGRAGVRIGAFRYRGSDYPPYWVTNVLEGAIEAKNAVVDCGVLLNRHLGLGCKA